MIVNRANIIIAVDQADHIQIAHVTTEKTLYAPTVDPGHTPLTVIVYHVTILGF